MARPAGAKEAYTEILNEPEIAKALHQYQDDIDPSLISNYISDLDEFLRNKEKCNGCVGLNSCRQPIKGHYPTLKPSYKQLKVAYTPCQYALNQKHLENIKSFHMPADILNANFEQFIMDPERAEFYEKASLFIHEYMTTKKGRGLYLYGPFGTGKTYTMAKIANAYLKNGKSVLIVSHSNVSVDGVVKKVVDLLDPNMEQHLKKGNILRFGYVRDEELSKHPYATSFNYALSNNPTLNNELNILSKKREDHKKIAIQVSDISQLEQLDLHGVEQVFVPFYQYQAQCDKYIPYVPFLYDEQDFIEFLNSVYYQKCQSIQVNDFGALNLVNDKNIVLGYHMNITNNKAIQEFNLPFVISYEASKNDIQSFKTNQDIYFTAYSQIINMNLKHCIISNHYFSRKQKGCHLCKQHQYCLKDRKEMNFKIVTDQYCNNYVLHTHRFYFDKINDLNVDYILLNFLDETSQEIQTIVNDYLNITKHSLSKNKNNYDIFQGYFTK